MNAQVSALQSEENHVLASEEHARNAFQLVDWRKYDGQRVTASKPGAVFVVINGQLHAIPDTATYNNLFTNWTTILVSDYLIDEMPRGVALSAGAVLAKGNVHGAAFLITNGRKHWIPNTQIFDLFSFNARNVNVVAQVIIDAVPQGSDIG